MQQATSHRHVIKMIGKRPKILFFRHMTYAIFHQKDILLKIGDTLFNLLKLLIK